VAASGRGEEADFGAGQIGERVALEMAPHVLNRVQLRSIGREVKLPPLPYVNKDRDPEVTMDSGTIPDQQQRIVKGAGELAEKSQPRRRIEVFIDQQLKIQPHFATIRTDAQGGNGGDLLAVAANVSEHWGLSAPAPGAPHHRQQEQPAFIQENQPSLQAPGFFLIRGHSSLIRRWMPSSSRSKARRVGRCGVQPSERSRRPI
jgi:hypothetical protein